MVSRGLNLQPDGEIERWWLCFSPAVEPAGWWKHFTRAGFGHIYLFRQPKSGILIALNPLVHRVENAIVCARASDLIQEAHTKGYRILVFERTTRVYCPHTDVRVGRGLFLTCASYAAYTIGVPFSWRSTPWQLWKAALKAGAVELERRQIHLQPTSPQEGQRGREAP